MNFRTWCAFVLISSLQVEIKLLYNLSLIILKD